VIFHRIIVAPLAFIGIFGIKIIGGELAESAAKFDTFELLKAPRAL
jgi:hypothetical protein